MFRFNLFSKANLDNTQNNTQKKPCSNTTVTIHDYDNGFKYDIENSSPKLKPNVPHQSSSTPKATEDTYRDNDRSITFRG